MLTTRFVPVVLLLTLSSAVGQEYSVELIDSPPDSDQVSEDLLEQLADNGVRVKQGTSRTSCEIWLCKNWLLDADFTATAERLYPFSPGQLIGVLHFRRRGSDFRDQNLSRGWYTLRFGLQPVDGNHEGTSATRDFLVLVSAEQDAADKSWKLKDLMAASAEAAGSTHPALICLQKAEGTSKAAIRHDESNDWWILHVTGQGMAGEQPQDVPVEMVVIGHATE